MLVCLGMRFVFCSVILISGKKYSGYLITMKIFFLAAFLCLLCITVSAQEKPYTITIRGNYITSGGYYPAPYAERDDIRNFSYYYEDIFSTAISFRYLVAENIFIALETDIINAKERLRSVTVYESGNTKTIAVDDGFTIYPLSLTFYYRLPFSMERWKFYMSGGFSYYLASHNREFGSISTEKVSQDFAYGIHVGIGFEVYLFDNIPLFWGMKFSEPDIEVTSRYSSSEGVYEGRAIRVLNEDFKTRVTIDGISFQIGVGYNFDL